MSNEALLLKNQVCFSVYRLSKLITSQYRPYLDELGITYPQYLVLLVLWEVEKTNMRELGNKLSLDTGTLTPLIKRLIDKGIVEKQRSKDDERVVYIKTTKEGNKLKTKAKSIPEKLTCAHQADLNKIRKLKELADSLYQEWEN